MTDPETARMIGANITAARLAAGIQQRALAERLGITQSGVCDWEKGRKVPQVERLLEVAAILGCPLLELLKGAGAEPDAYRKGYEDGWRAAGNAMHAALVKGPHVGSLGLGAAR